MHYALFSTVDIIYTMHYTVFSEGGYYLYYALQSIFGGWILFILCTKQYSREVDTIYTMHYGVFSEGVHNLYYVLRSIFEGEYYLNYALQSIFGGGY